MFTKKIRKLRHDPKLFFKDMINKRLHKWGLLPNALNISAPITSASKSEYQYTVVSAVYNVHKYLDYYFRTLTSQTIGFERCIRLIMVDDGSTDQSAEIIKRWQSKYPNNISYVHKENGGQASARNLGLNYVETDFVTFIDPDDFVSKDYFEKIDQFLVKNKNKSICMLSCNQIFFYEKTGIFKDTHPLRYRFLKGDVCINLNDIGKNLQLSVNSVLFDMDVIRRTSLRFGENIKPNFEDGHFVGRYLAQAGRDGSIGFMKNSKYYYRKREDGTSTLDSSWSNPGFFDEVMRLGYIDLINFYKEISSNQVPLNIQRTVLYDTFWRVKEIINQPEKLQSLANEQRQNFLRYLDEIYTSIDNQTILDFELAGCWFYYKVGLLNCFKQKKPQFQIVYLEAFDVVKQLLHLVYFSGSEDAEQFLIDGMDISPVFTKTAKHDFLDRTFLHQRHVWLPIGGINENTLLSVNIAGNDSETRLSLGGKQFKNGLLIREIKKYFETKAEFVKSSDTWLLMDRDTQADDNAEHFYRYVRKKYPEQDIQFVLRKDSHDWSRLKEEGFNLLAYGSIQHENALRKCGKIISSHADQYVIDYFKDGALKKKPFIFLQHGIIHNDLSRWLNTKKIDCLITSSRQEFESISGNHNRYKFSKKEVVLTGMSRHDALLVRQKEVPAEKIIFIAPTWRHSLMGEHLDGNLRETNPEFMSSKYAQTWQSFLCSDELFDFAENKGYKIVFFPHANIQPYLEEFRLPSHIVVASHSFGSIQDWFCRSEIMITDYSSVAFEMAYLEKPVFYFQFDREEIYSGAHMWQPGYFNYDRDGFGPVCFDNKSLIDELKLYMEKGSKFDDVYLNRMRQFFSFRDGNNCERIYQAIKNLDSPKVDDELANAAVWESAIKAENNDDWALAGQRWKQMLEQSLSKEKRAEASWRYVNSLVRQGIFIEDIKLGVKLYQNQPETKKTDNIYE